MCNRLCSRLTPYFVSEHPVRGRVPGPFDRLPIGGNLRKLILHLVVTLIPAVGSKEVAQGLLKAARECAREGMEECLLQVFI